MSLEVLNKILNDKRRVIPSYDRFINEGKYIGSGSFKSAYRIGNYVMCVPNDMNDKWSMQQFYAQISYWENNKNYEEVCDYLNPIIKHGTALEPYYISLYCDPINEQIYLTEKDFKRITDHTDPNDLYFEDVIKADNQGILFGKPVLIDYGMTHEDFFNWRLDEDGVEPVFCDNYIYGRVGMVSDVIKLEYILNGDILEIKDIQVDEDWELTQIIEVTLNELREDFKIIENYKRRDNNEFRL